jgi:hypothetical protein
MLRRFEAKYGYHQRRALERALFLLAAAAVAVVVWAATGAGQEGEHVRCPSDYTTTIVDRNGDVRCVPPK